MKKIIAISALCLPLLISSFAHADIYDDTVSNSARSESDRKLDARRKPAEVMRFFEIKPGANVLDVFAGGGYYSEMLSYLVGPAGSVTLYNNAPWDAFVDKAVTARLADNRLPNIERLVQSPESLQALERKYTTAIFILGWHDVYYADEETGWVAIDKQAFLQGIYQLLEPGAVFGVIDANAESGANNALVGKDLHRVDPQVMIDDILAAGFELEASSDLLRNPNDDRSSSVFKPENRYTTDRSILKFRKPEIENN